jgi:hypothetical protein
MYVLRRSFTSWPHEPSIQTSYALATYTLASQTCSPASVFWLLPLYAEHATSPVFMSHARDLPKNFTHASVRAFICPNSLPAYDQILQDAIMQLVILEPQILGGGNIMDY